MLLAFALAISIVPGTPDATYRQPQIAVTDKLIALTFGAGNNVYFASSHDGGAAFSTPVHVNAHDPGKLPLGRHRGPRIAISGNSIVITAILGKSGGGADGDVFSWHSTDGGKTFSHGVRVNDVERAAREGLDAMAASNNAVFATWLDLREKGTRLYGSVSRDGGHTWSKNVLVYESPDGHICECCHPSAMITPSGEIYAMWRNRLNGARDMYAASSTDGGKTFAAAARLGTGTWPLNACPMDGGGITIARDGKVWSAFRRENTVILAQATEKELGSGKDPAIAAGKKGVAVAWTEGGIRVLVPGKDEPETLDAAGAFAHLAGADHIYAAWESGHTIKVARID